MHFNALGVFYPQFSHQHVSAAIAAIFGVIKMIQFVWLILLGCPSWSATALTLMNGVLGSPNSSPARMELRKKNVTCNCGTHRVSGELNNCCCCCRGSRYCKEATGWLQVPVSGKDIRLLQNVNTGPRVQTASYSIDNRGSFLSRKANRAWGWHRTSFDVKNRLCCKPYSAWMPSRHV